MSYSSQSFEYVDDSDSCGSLGSASSKGGPDAEPSNFQPPNAPNRKPNCGTKVLKWIDKKTSKWVEKPVVRDKHDQNSWSRDYYLNRPPGKQVHPSSPQAEWANAPVYPPVASKIADASTPRATPSGVNDHEQVPSHTEKEWQQAPWGTPIIPSDPRPTLKFPVCGKKVKEVEINDHLDAHENRKLATINSHDPCHHECCIAACPVCNQLVRILNMNTHLDSFCRELIEGVTGAGQHHHDSSTPDPVSRDPDQYIDDPGSQKEMESVADKNTSASHTNRDNRPSDPHQNIPSFTFTDVSDNSSSDVGSNHHHKNKPFARHTFRSRDSSVSALSDTSTLRGGSNISESSQSNHSPDHQSLARLSLADAHEPGRHHRSTSSHTSERSDSTARPSKSKHRGRSNHNHRSKRNHHSNHSKASVVSRQTNDSWNRIDPNGSQSTFDPEHDRYYPGDPRLALQNRVGEGRSGDGGVSDERRLRRWLDGIAEE